MRREKLSVVSCQLSVVSGQWGALAGLFLSVWGGTEVGCFESVFFGHRRTRKAAGGVGCRVSGILACCFVGGKGLVGRF